jgi:hypothetical protein
MATAVVTSNITDVRALVRNLRRELENDPTMMKRFGNEPRAVLHDYGLAKNVQTNLLREDLLNAHPNNIRCFCGSYWSIITTITTGASSDDN